jgi:uncharacterized YigZ family protein
VKTLAAPARFEAEIKRSRFIAHAARVDSMADTLDFYESVADPSATHNCWAWRLDHRYRFNDDGEPASTAGKPIHAAIEGKGLDNVMVVVTRYYGGIKLGVGGLVRAYGGGASKCLDQAVVVEVLPKVNCLIEADFKWTGQLYAALDACEAKRLGEDYPPGRVQIRAELLESAVPGLKEQLRDATRGEALVRLAV